MHVSELVELAAMLASNVVAFRCPLDDMANAGLKQYWSASKARQQRWHRALKRCSQRCRTDLDPDGSWLQTAPVMEEILVSEILTRVWTARCCNLARDEDTQEAEPIVRSVLAGHLEARHRTLNLLILGFARGIDRAAELNQLRSHCERWNDLLIGQLLGPMSVNQFAFSRDRARTLKDTTDAESDHETRWLRWRDALRRNLRPVTSDKPPNADLNRVIASAVTSCLLTDSLAPAGLTDSLWLRRMENTALDAQVLIDKLIRLGTRDKHPFGS